MSVIGGRIVQTPAEQTKYKVVLQHSDGLRDTEHAVATMREGEALIRERLEPLPVDDERRDWSSALFTPSKTSSESGAQKANSADKQNS